MKFVHEMDNVLKFLMCFYLVASVHGRSIEDIRQEFINLGIECSKDHEITADEMMQLQKHVIPDSPNVKCLLACVYKKAGYLDDKGMFDIDNAKKMIEKEHIDDQDKMEKSKKLFEVCKKVNEETASDGEKGCERSASLAKCLIDQAPKVGINEFMSM